MMHPHKAVALPAGLHLTQTMQASIASCICPATPTESPTSLDNCKISSRLQPASGNPDCKPCSEDLILAKEAGRNAAGMVQDESDQRFNQATPLEVPSDMLLPPIGPSGRGPTLRQQHMWAGRVGVPSSWATSHDDFEYDHPAPRVRRRTPHPRLLHYQGQGDASRSTLLIPRGFLRKPPPGSNAEVGTLTGMVASDCAPHMPPAE